MLLSFSRVVLVGVCAALLAPATAQPTEKPDHRAPRSANPYTAFLPAEVTPDYAYWNAEIARRSRARSIALPPMRVAATTYDETEPVGSRGDNDSFDSAEVIGGFGTASDPVLTIRGDLATGFDGTPPGVAPFPEEDGSIGDASDTGLSARGAIVVEGATLGDGTYGATSGDFDYYAVTAMAPGVTLRVDIDTPTGNLDPTLTLISASGTLIAFNDDFDGLDSFLEVELPAAGTYYVFVAAFGSSPGAYTDPASGNGARSTGPYDLLIGLPEPDTDVFAIDLQAGDIIGVGEGAATVASIDLLSPDGVLRMGSQFDLSGLYPTDSPLPGGGASFATGAIVASVTGRYRLAVRGEGPFEIGVRAFRPRLEADPGGIMRQTLYVDFDGETGFNAGIFGGNPNATLSPLSAFLPNWGFDPSDEDALIDGILAVLQEKLSDDLLAAGNNPMTAVDILNSRDDAFPADASGVSRLIVGGTIQESGVSTIGVASSIDPGNFGLDDVAIILLDLLSDSASNPNSLNQYAIAPGASKLDFIAQGVGNIVAHEAGHFLGLYHTDQFNATPNIIDQGGNLANTVGVGADRVFGTADDVNVDIVADSFVPSEGLLGVEDGTNIIAFGLSSQVAVATEGAPEEGDARVFPNPVTAGALLHIEGTNLRATVYDALGRLAAEAEAPSDLALATDGLAPGVYVVRIEDGATTRRVTVTVVR